MDKLRFERAKHELRCARDKYIQNLRAGEAAMLTDCGGPDIVLQFVAGASNSLKPITDNWHLPRIRQPKAVKLIAPGDDHDQLREFVMLAAERDGVAGYFPPVQIIAIGSPPKAEARDKIEAMVEPGDFLAIASHEMIADNATDAAHWIAYLAKRKGAVIVVRTDTSRVHPRRDNLKMFRSYSDGAIWIYDRQLTIPVKRARRVFN